MKLQNIKNTLIPAVANQDIPAMLKSIDYLLNLEDCGPGWKASFSKLETFLRTGIPEFSILSIDGNSKLPFISFSALPGAGFCPGAGDCLSFCYSFRSWRYPAALCRQIQNTLLLNTENGREYIRQSIRKALAGRKYQAKIQAGQKIDFRLYVDGDFRHLADLEFWFNFLKTDAGQNLAVYGYSKSFEIFQEFKKTGQAFPDNYLLNMSSGHKYDAAIVSDIEKLSITRGHFKAVPVAYKVKSAMHNDRAHQKNLRKAYGKKAFTCPGRCGECTLKAHACGSKKFTGIDIIIAVH